MRASIMSMSVWRGRRWASTALSKDAATGFASVEPWALPSSRSRQYCMRTSPGSGSCTRSRMRASSALKA
jgi:hypothetical protein